MNFEDIVKNNDFQAIMLDFDGTITEKGVYGPSDKMAAMLVEVAKKMPLSFCTGRQLESFVKRGFSALTEAIPEEEHAAFFKNLHLVAENGSVGYYYDLEKSDFEKFYEVAWPEHFVKREELQNLLDEHVSDYGSIYYEAHKVIIVMRTNMHDYAGRDMNDVYALSQKIYELTHELLEDKFPGYEDHLHVGNSGIGVIVCPAEGDKDRGVREFSKFLMEKDGLKFDKNLRDMLIIGDSAQPGGNDHYFLKGEVGTPFNVGEYRHEERFPIPVTSASGESFLHAEGTEKILRLLLT